MRGLRTGKRCRQRCGIEGAAPAAHPLLARTCQARATRATTRPSHARAPRASWRRDALAATTRCPCGRRRAATPAAHAMRRAGSRGALAFAARRARRDALGPPRRAGFGAMRRTSPHSPVVRRADRRRRRRGRRFASGQWASRRRAQTRLDRRQVPRACVAARRAGPCAASPAGRAGVAPYNRRSTTRAPVTADARRAFSRHSPTRSPLRTS